VPGAAQPIADLESSRLPGLLRVLNALGGPLADSRARLDEEDLLAAARRRTGLGDYGDDSFLGPLRILLDSLQREAQLSALGRISTRQLLLQLLSNRLLIEDRIRRNPEILDERIERPIIIAGPPLPRSASDGLAGSEAFAEFALEHLARGVAGQGVDDLEAIGDLLGHEVLAPHDHVIQQLSAVAEDHASRWLANRGGSPCGASGPRCLA
jgi:hypothetical protein